MDKKLLEKVLIEANNIRHHASKKEKDKLLLNILKPSSRTNCIYSLMCEHYISKRCIELLNSCCEPYSSNYMEYNKPKNKSFTQDIDRDYSAIEFYSSQKGANNKDLIEYIKGNINSIEL